MAEPVSRNLLQALAAGGSACVLFAGVVCALALWLFASRLRGCFRVQPANFGRDLVFLLAGPVLAMLYASISALTLAQHAVHHTFSWCYNPYFYESALAFSGVSMGSFTLGVAAFALPVKRPPAAGQGW